MNGSFTPETGLQWCWDSTSIKLAGACQYKYYLRMIEGWQGRGLSVHLRFGQHYATALEHYYKHIALGMDANEATREVVREALIDTWDREREYKRMEDFEPPYDYAGWLEDEARPNELYRETAGQPWNSLDNNKTRESLIRSIVWYLDHFAEDDLPIVILPSGVPAVEHSFLLPVDDEITFSGHLDRLVEYAGGTWVMDQKTTKSTISPHYFDGYNPDDQMSMYTFAGQATFHTPVRGVIIDAAQIAVGFTRFERGFTARSQTQLDEWYDCTMELIELTRKNTLRKHFPLNPTACGNYGGCEFRMVCSRSPEVRNQFLKGNFEKTDGWDPSARR